MYAWVFIVIAGRRICLMLGELLSGQDGRVWWKRERERDGKKEKADSEQMSKGGEHMLRINRRRFASRIRAITTGCKINPNSQLSGLLQEK